MVRQIGLLREKIHNYHANPPDVEEVAQCINLICESLDDIQKVCTYQYLYRNTVADIFKKGWFSTWMESSISFNDTYREFVHQLIIAKKRMILCFDPANALPLLEYDSASALATFDACPKNNCLLYWFLHEVEFWQSLSHGHSAFARLTHLPYRRLRRVQVPPEIQQTYNKVMRKMEVVT